jgi:arginine decarboxylase
VEFGMPLGVGLECGSKAELQAILGITESIQPIIVCNGYKDEEYMRLALMGQKLGHTVFVVLEQLSELDTLFKVADELGVSPTVGVRSSWPPKALDVGPRAEEKSRSLA